MSIFFDMIEKIIEVFMDDFTFYGTTFNDCLENLDKVCQCFTPGGSHQRVKLVCAFPFPDGDARKTQRFILVWARRGPTSSGGRYFYYLAPKCLYRGEYKLGL